MSQPSTLLSKLPYAALLAYSPRGQSETADLSRKVCNGVKQWQPAVTKRLRQILLEGVGKMEIGQVLGPDVIVVPCPRSAPVREGTLWPALEICRLLLDCGFCERIEQVVRREKAVVRSHTAAPGNRPTVQMHYESMSASTLMHSRGQRITIVDDVITKGNTLIAGASRLNEAVPDAVIQAFAIVRTRGLVPDISQIRDPVFGTIDYFGFDASRSNN